jgi:hypothetical protein
MDFFDALYRQDVNNALTITVIAALPLVAPTPTAYNRPRRCAMTAGELDERAKAFKREWKAELLRRRAGYAAEAGVPDVADLFPLLHAVAQDVREACAKMAEEDGTEAGRRIAARIRTGK